MTNTTLLLAFPSTTAWLLIIAFAIAAVYLWYITLPALMKREPMHFQFKQMWIVVVMFVPVFGALLYRVSR